MRVSTAFLFACFVLIGCQPADAPSTPSSVRGIDLSHHNGRVDWDAIETSDIGFVYLKATEGRSHKDSSFQDNWREATARGYTVGAYHFFRFCVDGEAQADNFIQSVEPRSGALPPAIDVEYAENCQPKSDAALAADLTVALEKLEAEYGEPPAIYTTQDAYADHIAGRYTRHPIWIRGLDAAPPELPDGRNWTIWQYDMRGQLDGIDGDVDLNRMDQDQLGSLIDSKSTFTPK